MTIFVEKFTMNKLSLCLAVTLFLGNFKMNIVEKDMLEILKSLRQDYGILGIKADFEAEGSRLEETFRLKELLEKAKLDLFVKIGGCEAIGDLYSCKELNVKGVIAPMIESEFAVEKFLNAIQMVYCDKASDVDWMINLETKQAVANVDDICNRAHENVKGVVIGRVDLSSSMGLSRCNIDSKAILEPCVYLSQKAKAYGLSAGFGGGITFKTIPFIIKMSGLVSKFESRKVIFRHDTNEVRLKGAISKAAAFELLYLKNKENYGELTTLDKKRFNIMLSRLEEMENSL